MKTVGGEVQAARRVARFIGVIKWLVVLLYVFAGVVWSYALSSSEKKHAFGTSLEDMQVEVEKSFNGPLFAVLLIATAVGAVVVWVMYGWFEHVLRMLARIADNGIALKYQAQVAYDTHVQQAVDAGNDKPEHSGGAVPGPGWHNGEDHGDRHA